MQHQQEQTEKQNSKVRQLEQHCESLKAQCIASELAAQAAAKAAKARTPSPKLDGCSDSRAPSPMFGGCPNELISRQTVTTANVATDLLAIVSFLLRLVERPKVAE